MSQYHIRTYRYDGFADRFYLKPTVHWNGENMEVWAVLDTGANITHVSKRVIEKLNPKWIGNIESVSAYSKYKTSKYKLNITFSEFGTFPEVTVGVLEQIQPVADLIVGMDLITKFDFAITSDEDGNTILSLRYPSKKKPIDFNEDD